MSHPAFDRLMANIPLEISQTFTDAQLVALSLASIPRNAPHSIDYRVSIPFFGGRRFYLTLLAGKDRRSYQRLAREGLLPSGQLGRVDGTIVSIGAGLGLLAFVLALYITKAALGIDLFEGDPAVHEVFRQLNIQPAL